MISVGQVDSDVVVYANDGLSQQVSLRINSFAYSPVIMTVLTSASPTPTAIVICPLLANPSRLIIPSVAFLALTRGAHPLTAAAANTKSVCKMFMAISQDRRACFTSRPICPKQVAPTRNATIATPTFCSTFGIESRLSKAYRARNSAFPARVLNFEYSFVQSL